METADLADLPPTFTYQQARVAGVAKRRLYELRDNGALEQVGHGLFHQAALPWSADVDLIEIALRAPKATLCLASALARHDLTDLIPASIDVALPRNQWRPVIKAPVTWHSFRPRCAVRANRARRRPRRRLTRLQAGEHAQYGHGLDER
jgi:hypothetical protein